MLAAEVARARRLSAKTIGEMFTLFERHYEGTDRDRFHEDLSEKQWVLLFRQEGELVGFSTQTVIESRNHPFDMRARALFSGDTVIDRAHWGSQSLMKAWCRFAGSVLSLDPEAALYWFLLSKGHRTYLYLPLFFLDFYPSRNGTRDPKLWPLLCHLASERYGQAFDVETGCVFPAATHDRLREELDTTPIRRQNPDVEFFSRRNPRYADGVELACLAPIAPENLRGVARRELEAGIALGIAGL